jgi:2-dehydro-3-deoxygluconokinase
MLCSMNTEVVTLGEAMRLLLAEPGVALRRAHTFTSSVAGAETNVAVGLARLGHGVRWLSRVGGDPSGAHVLATLRADGVDVSRVEVDPERYTGFLVRDTETVEYHRSGSAASGLSAAYVREAGLDGARLVHVSGITAMLSADAREAVEALFALARASGAWVSFDPNVRLKLDSPERWRETVGPLLTRADLVFAGEDELELLGQAPDALLAGRAQTVIVKQRDKIARAVTADGSWSQPSLVTRVVDPVGAGDALTSGYLSAWLRGASPAEALRSGAACAALVVGTRTDLEGLPDQGELAKALIGTEVDR